MNLQRPTLSANTSFTGLKTTKLLEKGLRKVLFINETYHRGMHDRFVQEDIDQMDSLLTQDTIAGKIVAVFVRHTEDMSVFFFSANVGFSWPLPSFPGDHV